MKNDRKAIILCSGGLDSVVTSFYVKKRLGYNKIKILFFNYGQKAIMEERKYSLECAQNIGAEFMEVNMSWLAEISDSLINKDGRISKLRRKDLKNTSKESEKFYVPCRNTLFINYAIAIAESYFVKNKDLWDIFVGFKCEGKESYPDTTKRFVAEINRLAKISCLGKFRILAPMIEKDKEDIILIGKKLGVDFRRTISCYSPKNKKHCGFCLACKLRKEGFYWANIEDNSSYAELK